MFGYPAMSTAPPRGRELNAPRRPARAHGALLSRGRAPRPPGSGLAPPPAAAGRRAGPPSPLSPKKRWRTASRLAVTKGIGTPTPKEPSVGPPGPLWAPRRAPSRPGKGRGSPRPPWGVGEGPRSRHSLDAWGRAQPCPGGARCRPVNCVSRETLLQACLQFDSVNLWCYTYTVIYTLYTRS